MRMSVVNKYYRKARVVVLISIWALLWLALFLNNKVARRVILAIGIIPMLFLCMPGYRHDKAFLRQEYVNELSKYENVDYVWGGEKRSGIDCSGLIRAGLINANIRLGIIGLNP